MSTSIISLSQKPEAKTCAASLVSQLNITTKPEDVYLTYDQLQKRNQTMHKRFTTFFTVYSLLSNIFYLWLVFLGKIDYLSQAGTCKLVFFSKFYILLVMNLMFIVVHFVGLLSFLKDKFISRTMYLNSPRCITSLFIAQLTLGSLDYMFESDACTPNMQPLINKFFAFEIIQFMITALFNFFYHYRVFKDVEMSIALEDESVDAKKTQEKFNGSFALNLSNLGPSMKDKFRYKRTLRQKGSATKNKDDITVNDLDNLRIVKKENREGIIERLTRNLEAHHTPTKNLSKEFEKADIEDSTS